LRYAQQKDGLLEIMAEDCTKECRDILLNTLLIALAPLAARNERLAPSA
jgi:hypothetical protein